MEHAFNTNVAKEYDVYIAILLNNLKFWTLTNLANKNNIHDGLCWTYNTVQAFGDIFPYWTRHQLEHLLSKCEKLGLIVSSNYNSHKYDRKKWYAMTAKTYKLFPELAQEHFITLLWDSISEKTEMSKLHPDISENSELSLGKFREAFLKNPEPIADINTDEKPYIKPIGTSDDVPQDEDKSLILSPKPKKQKPESFGIEALLSDNPHGIDQQHLEDWIKVRKSKRAAITKTTWNKINRTLEIIEREAQVKPRDAFETMVASGWQSLELKYFLGRTAPLPKKSKTLAELTHGIDLNQVDFL